MGGQQSYRRLKCNMFAFLPCLLNIWRKFEFLISQGSVATRLRWDGYCHSVANFMCFPAVQKFWKSVKIWQSYREFKAGNFFETQCRALFCVNIYGSYKLSKNSPVFLAQPIDGKTLTKAMSQNMTYADIWHWAEQTTARILCVRLLFRKLLASMPRQAVYYIMS